MQAVTKSNQAVEGCREACRRSIAAIEHIFGGPGKLEPENIKKVGGHFRHCIDHFRSLFRAIPTGIVDYDARDRDPEIEQSPDRMLEAFEEIEQELALLSSATVSRSLLVRQLSGPGEGPAVTGSCFERELAYVSAHTIHHLALISLLASQFGRPVPPELIFAFSTAAHLKTTAAVAH